MIALALVAWTSAVAAAEPPSALARARYFLEIFAKNPPEAKKFVTSDARMVVGDIGGTFNDYLGVIRRHSNPFSSCRVGHLEARPSPVSADLKDSPPWMKGSEMSLFEGEYDCVLPDGSSSTRRVSVILKNDRVFMFQLGGAQ
ncbi:MAG TPA: hypothetical protein VKC17_05515 [Sphingomicrobium sp.]|nr:hypothetical protein [Sphingomicrobium sp.]